MPATPPPAPIATLIHGLRLSRQFLDKSLAGLAEVDSGFAPKPGMFTVAQQLAHIGQTMDWFHDGAFAPAGFSMDFASGEAAVRKVDSLATARAWVASACDTLVKRIEAEGESGMARPLAQGPIMGGQPRSAIIGAIADHNAHHRGSLVVYMRLLGKVPGSPYG